MWKYFLVNTVLLCCIISSSLAEVCWHPLIVERRPLFNGLGTYRLIHFHLSDARKTFYSYVVVLHPGYYQASILDQPNLRKYLRVADTTLQENTFLSINGGFYTAEFMPLGLSIVDGKKISSLVHNRLLAGLLLIDKQGQISIEPWDHPLDGIAFAIQTGPFLIKPGGIVGVYEAATKEERRTVVALACNKDLLVISTSAVSLRDLAVLLKDRPEVFGVDKIDRALNLDGGRSTALSLRLPDQFINISEIAPVRNMLLFNFNPSARLK